ncbi:hypothetical protein HanRHA438_Chr14g0667591 [Helianthus annuus]|nr:hypothetical protein HanIR_Chr14g0712521 [Helianthus annuus]KAJ0854897.1 hypothetical protein HanRHA438_Chr14g0667591 [Helianthus annuus]
MAPKSRASLHQGCAQGHTPYSTILLVATSCVLRHIPLTRREVQPEGNYNYDT